MRQYRIKQLREQSSPLAGSGMCWRAGLRITCCANACSFGREAASAVGFRRHCDGIARCVKTAVAPRFACKRGWVRPSDPETAARHLGAAMTSARFDGNGVISRGCNVVQACDFLVAWLHAFRDLQTGSRGIGLNERSVL